MSWTPRELIESLSKWEADEDVEVGVQSIGDGFHIVIVSQGLNTINLSDPD